MVSIRYRKNRKAWEVDFREDGRRHRQHFHDKKNAWEFVELKENQLERKRAAMSHLTMATFDEWADIFCRNYFKLKSKSYTDNTSAQIRRVYLKHFGGKYLHEITKTDIIDFRDMRLADGASSKTVINDLQIIRIMFVKAVEQGYALDNPCEGVESPKNVPRKIRGAVDLEDIKKLLRVADDELKKGILLLLNLGIRLGELFHLKGSDFNPANRFVSIRSVEGQTTKNLKSRVVPLPAVIIELVTGMGPDEPVMNIVQATFERKFQTLRSKLKFTWSLHELRHTYVSRMLKAGVDKRSLREYVGHQSDEILDRYSHYIPENMEAKINFGEEFVRGEKGVVTIWSPRPKNPLFSDSLSVPPPGVEPGQSCPY